MRRPPFSKKQHLVKRSRLVSGLIWRNTAENSAIYSGLLTPQGCNDVLLLYFFTPWIAQLVEALCYNPTGSGFDSL
jgi:hypothetical protein